MLLCVYLDDIVDGSEDEEEEEEGAAADVLKRERQLPIIQVDDIIRDIITHHMTSFITQSFRNSSFIGWCL